MTEIINFCHVGNEMSNLTTLLKAVIEKKRQEFISRYRLVMVQCYLLQ